MPKSGSFIPAFTKVLDTELNNGLTFKAGNGIAFDISRASPVFSDISAYN